ncbi:MAG: hypothetical protein CVV22_11505 [Ignavibacteriae bacterium HGW-Ignavibacteriae-1]|jgi:hypothetical protein|nr:MAG: hypothetical protein CVV22_11505 [Ignavibacteriae bacterium HGW-Ignavibacteriae-1]
MKYFVLFIAFLLIFAFTANAQITINRADYTLNPSLGFNSTQVVEASMFLPTEGENQTWDYSGIELGLQYSEGILEAGTDSEFDGANYYNMSGQSPFGDFQEITFWYQLNDERFVTLGRKLGYTTSVLTGVTNNPMDSIVLVGNTDVYAQPSWLLKFPMTYGLKMESEFELSVDYELTVQIYGIDKVPGYNRQEWQTEWEVAGWGTLILPNPNGGDPISVEALLVKNTEIFNDNYYLNGELAAEMLTKAFGLKQGEVYSYTDYKFFAKGLPRSVLSMRYSNDNEEFTSSSMSSDVSSIASVSESQTSFPIEAKVFPNPMVNQFNVQFDKTDSQTWTIEVFDNLGKKLQSQKISQEIGEINTIINLENSAPGFINYSIRNASGQIMSAGKLIKE